MTEIYSKKDNFSHKQILSMIIYIFLPKISIIK